MSRIISLNVTKRNSGSREDIFTTPKQYGFDVKDIVVPIRNNGTVSYFTTRQLKGNTPASRVVGQTDYQVEESLADIAAKSISLVLLDVVRRRDVAATEQYVFVVGRISEALVSADAGGTIFFYQEDGDPDLVEFEVSQTIDEIIALITPVAATPGHVIADEGVDLPQRGRLNFVGAGATVTDGPGDDTTVTIPGSMPMMVTDIDMNTAFLAGVLTIPPAFQEYDSFNLINGSGSNISEIVGLSTQPLKVQRFTVELGSTQNFVHAPVATATANQLISDAALTNPVIGDDAGMIEYEVVTIAGPIQVNRRYNATLPA